MIELQAGDIIRLKAIEEQTIKGRKSGNGGDGYLVEVVRTETVEVVRDGRTIKRELYTTRNPPAA